MVSRAERIARHERKRALRRKNLRYAELRKKIDYRKTRHKS
jgi:hypothetical protein